jgi:hypothetical protein
VAYITLSTRLSISCTTSSLHLIPAMDTSRACPLSVDYGSDYDRMIVRMFLGSGAGYYGDRKCQNDCESNHDPDLTHPPAHTTCLDHNAGCRPTKARLIGSLVQIVGRLKHGGFPQPFRHSPMNSSDNLSGLGQMVLAMSDWAAMACSKVTILSAFCLHFPFCWQGEPRTSKIWRQKRCKPLEENVGRSLKGTFPRRALARTLR